MNHRMIAARVFGTPLLVDPAKGAAFLTGLGPRIAGGAVEFRGLDAVPDERARRAARVGERASILTNDVGERRRQNGRSLYRVRDGVAVIEVTGTLAHRGEHIGESSGVTSYEGLVAQIDAAGSDPNVRGVALEIDTFGGEVAGVFDLADMIRDLRAVKPVWAFVAEAALSAGYAIASQADRIIVPRTGEVGSIGVLTLHADYSQMLDDQGVAVTLIYAGSHKVDGNPYAALPEDIRADIQERVEETRDLFAETVAAGRGSRLSAAAALATEAQIYRGKHAVTAGLADEVSDLRKAFAGFVADINAPGGGLKPRAGQTAETKGAQSMKKGDQKAPSADGEVAEGQADTAAVVVEDDAPAAAGEEASALTDVRFASGDEAESGDKGETASTGTISTTAAADLVAIGQQAAGLGVKVDVADAIRRGLSADALRASVLEALVERGDRADIAPQTPAASSTPKASPLVAAAKTAVAAMKGA